MQGVEGKFRVGAAGTGGEDEKVMQVLAMVAVGWRMCTCYVV